MEQLWICTNRDTNDLGAIPQRFKALRISGFESQLIGATKATAIPIKPGGHR